MSSRFSLPGDTLSAFLNWSLRPFALAVANKAS